MRFNKNEKNHKFISLNPIAGFGEGAKPLAVKEMRTAFIFE